MKRSQAFLILFGVYLVGGLTYITYERGSLVLGVVAILAGVALFVLARRFA